MPGRKYEAQSGYRYGFNGKEINQLNQINYYDLGDRLFDTRTAKMLCVDPRAFEYPWQTSYAYHRNNPIWQTDFMGGGDPPEEPQRKSVEVKKGDNLWNIAKKTLGKEANNKTIVSLINEITCINNLNANEALNAGQVLYLETNENFSIRYKSYLSEKKSYDRSNFEEFPKPAHNPKYAYDPHPVEYMDKQMNFTRKASTLSELLDCSFSGVDVTVIKGGLLESLANQIRDMADQDDVNFYKKLVSQFKVSGQPYITGQITACFGSASKAKAFTQLSPYVMRGSQVKYWVSLNSNGTIKIEIRAYDYFNVTQETYKGRVYNGFAKFLDPLHKAAGGNSYMQTRASWEVNLK